MAVRVTIEREVIPGFQETVVDLLRELRSKSVVQPGYVSGQTVVDAFSPTKFLMISTWSSLDGWKEWEESSERLSMIEEISPYMQRPTKTRLWLDNIDAPPAAM